MSLVRTYVREGVKVYEPPRVVDVEREVWLRMGMRSLADEIEYNKRGARAANRATTKEKRRAARKKAVQSQRGY